MSLEMTQYMYRRSVLCLVLSVLGLMVWSGAAIAAHYGGWSKASAFWKLACASGGVICICIILAVLLKKRLQTLSGLRPSVGDATGEQSTTC